VALIELPQLTIEIFDMLLSTFTECYVCDVYFYTMLRG